MLAGWRDVLGLPPDVPRSLLFALIAGEMASQNSGWDSSLAGDRVGVIFGTYGDKLDMGRIGDIALQSRPAGVSEIAPAAFFDTYCRTLRGRQLHRLLSQHTTAALAQRFGATGLTCTIQTACTSSAQAIGEAYRAIRRGAIDRAITGGAECLVTPDHMMMFSLLGVLSTRNDEPERASRPFDANRDGFVLGEGGGVLVLERMDLAQGRGAPILCELAGYGTSCDAYRLTDEDPEGRGAVLAMQRTLESAGLDMEDVGYINAHGTFDPDERPRGNPRHQDLLRRPGRPDPGQLYEIHAGPHRVRRRRHRGHHLHPGASRSGPASDDQLRDPRPPVRPGLCARPRTARRSDRRALELLRLRGPQRLPGPATRGRSAGC